MKSVSSTDTAKRAAKYLRAARLITTHGGHGCCYALLDVQDEGERLFSEFAELFHPSFDPDGRCYWWGSLLDGDAQNERMLALCFMAAITERP